MFSCRCVVVAHVYPLHSITAAAALPARLAKEIYIYIYIYIEREMCYVYVYVHTCVYIYECGCECGCEGARSCCGASDRIMPPLVQVGIVT